jgi:hypothetical protein
MFWRPETTQKSAFDVLSFGLLAAIDYFYVFKLLTLVNQKIGREDPLCSVLSSLAAAVCLLHAGSDAARMPHVTPPLV